jgi:hypothetical protein
MPALTHAKHVLPRNGCPHLARPATCPPSASVRQASIADITLSWERLTCPVDRQSFARKRREGALARRHAGPWARKMSAISSFGRFTGHDHYSNPRRRVSSCNSFICSKGLTVPRIVLVATWV